MMLNARARMDSETLPEHMWMSRQKRNSSTYTNGSGFSVGTTNTTISDIVQMYKDYGKRHSQSPQNHGLSPTRKAPDPKAYRDTVAPLLEWRFSFEKHTPSTQTVSETPAQPVAPVERIINPRRTSTRLLIASSHASADSGDTLHGLKAFDSGPKSSLISPSAVERDQYIIVSKPAPAVPPTSTARRPSRNFSRKESFSTIAGDQVDDSQMRPGPLHVKGRDLGPRISDKKTEMAPQRTLNSSTKSTPNLRIFPIPQTSHIKRQASNIEKATSRTKSLTAASTRPNQGYPELPSQVDHLPHYQGDTCHRRRLQKKRSGRSMASLDPESNAVSTKYHIQDVPWTASRRKSVKESVHSMLRRMSITSHPKEAVGTGMPSFVPQRPVPMHPTLPTKSILGLDNEARQQMLVVPEKAARDGQGSEKTRPSLDRRRASQHRRTASGKSTSSIGSVFEGLKHSLGRRSSEKRREKLKASIVFIGPTTITAEDNVGYGY